MSWQLTADRPIYLQLIEEIELRIVSGMYTVGEKAFPGCGIWQRKRRSTQTRCRRL